MKLWLTKQEVIELTGKEQKQAQIRQLDYLGYHYRLRSDGSFIVPVDQFLQNVAHSPKTKLDFSAL